MILAGQCGAPKHGEHWVGGQRSRPTPPRPPPYTAYRNATLAPAACVCSVPAAPFGRGTGTIRYLGGPAKPDGDEIGFPFRCEQYPRETVLRDKNPVTLHTARHWTASSPVVCDVCGVAWLATLSVHTKTRLGGSRAWS